MHTRMDRRVWDRRDRAKEKEDEARREECIHAWIGGCEIGEKERKRREKKQGGMGCTHAWIGRKVKKGEVHTRMDEREVKKEDERGDRDYWVHAHAPTEIHIHTHIYHSHHTHRHTDTHTETYHICETIQS